MANKSDAYKVFISPQRAGYSRGHGLYTSQCIFDISSTAAATTASRNLLYAFREFDGKLTFLSAGKLNLRTR